MKDFAAIDFETANFVNPAKRNVSLLQNEM